MFKNAGGQLKGLAILNFWIFVIAGLIVGAALGHDCKFLIFTIPISLIIGCFSSVFIYAFGELCENVDRIANEYYDNNLKAKPKKKAKKTVKVIQSESKTDNEDEMTPENCGFLD